MALTKKQMIFADEYLIDLNATRAYKVAYPRIKSDEVSKAAASRLLTNVNVAAYVSERMQGQAPTYKQDLMNTIKIKAKDKTGGRLF